MKESSKGPWEAENVNPPLQPGNRHRTALSLSQSHRVLASIPRLACSELTPENMFGTQCFEGQRTV